MFWRKRKHERELKELIGICGETIEKEYRALEEVEEALREFEMLARRYRAKRLSVKKTIKNQEIIQHIFEVELDNLKGIKNVLEEA